jgi:Chaperone of endosialidase
MDDTRFDAWTRRRFGFAAGGLAAAVLGLAGSEDAQTKKKNKKRCKKLGAGCKPGGKRKCCGTLRCDQISFEPSPKTRCCRKEGDPCGDHLHCCDNLCCQDSGLCGTFCLSDRNRKANFGSVDPADMLHRVRDLPISTWNYTSDDASVRHIGPMAQEFAALFGVGADDRHIHPLDGQGVALAAIQGLVAQIEELREENARLAARVTRFETATWSSLLVRGRSSLGQYRN